MGWTVGYTNQRPLATTNVTWSMLVRAYGDREQLKQPLNYGWVMQSLDAPAHRIRQSGGTIDCVEFLELR